MLRKSPGLLALLVAGAWLFAAREVSAQPIGVIDQPTGGQTVSGVVKVTGWVLDFNQLDKVELLVDGTVVNRADTNLPRADVLEVFPTYVNSATPNPGFVSSFLANRFANGPHAISVRVTEASQATFTIGPSKIAVADHDTKMMHIFINGVDVSATLGDGWDPHVPGPTYDHAGGAKISMGAQGQYSSKGWFDMRTSSGPHVVMEKNPLVRMKPESSYQWPMARVTGSEAATASVTDCESDGSSRMPGWPSWVTERS